MAEQGSHKPRVGGSSPPAATTLRAHRSPAGPPPQTRTMAIPLAASHPDTFSQPAGSRCCHAVSAEAGTTTQGRLFRHTRSTNHARSVPGLSSASSAAGGAELPESSCRSVESGVASTMRASYRCRQEASHGGIIIVPAGTWRGASREMRTTVGRNFSGVVGNFWTATVASCAQIYGNASLTGAANRGARSSPPPLQI